MSLSLVHPSDFLNYPALSMACNAFQIKLYDAITGLLHGMALLRLRDAPPTSAELMLYSVIAGHCGRDQSPMPLVHKNDTTTDTR